MPDKPVSVEEAEENLKQSLALADAKGYVETTILLALINNASPDQQLAVKKSLETITEDIELNADKIRMVADFYQTKISV